MYNYVVLLLVAKLCSFETPGTVACQAPLSMGFPRQEYCSGLLFPSPGNLPDPRIELMSPALAGRFFTSQSPGNKSSQLYRNILSVSEFD